MHCLALAQTENYRYARLLFDMANLAAGNDGDVQAAMAHVAGIPVR